MNLMKKKKHYYQVITNIHCILKLWRSTNVSIKSKIIVFKTLAISKLDYLALFTAISNHIINEVPKIQKSFIWDDSFTKVKQEILGMNFKAGA